MGLLPSHIHLLARENTKHPIRGDVLTLGQQAVYATLNDVRNIIVTYDILPKKLGQNFDVRSKIPSWIGTYGEKYTNAQTVFTLLGAENVFVADYSKYENPDIVIDLNSPIDNEYCEKFDVLLDGGTLEHIFDIPTALFNIVKMLKKGGEAILVLPASNAIDHGFYSISPTLLYDFFSNNGFNNFSCYLREVSSFNLKKKGRVYRYNHVGSQYVLTSKKSVEIIFFATKTQDVKQIVKPMQSLYVNELWSNKQEVNRTQKKGNRKIFRSLRAILTPFLKEHRPELYDVLRLTKKRRKNLTYIGKF